MIYVSILLYINNNKVHQVNFNELISTLLISTPIQEKRYTGQVRSEVTHSFAAGLKFML